MEVYAKQKGISKSTREKGEAMMDCGCFRPFPDLETEKHLII
jgi:hypothetical protein